MRRALRPCAAAWAVAALVAACQDGGSRPAQSFDAGRGSLVPAADFSSPEEALKLAVSLRDAGADGEAFSLLGRAHRRYPQSGAITSAYGRLALIMGQEELAAGLLTAAVAADPSDWRALSALGVLDGRSGRLPEARKSLMRARALSAEGAMVLNNLALSDLLGGDAASAIPLFRKALASPALKPAHGVRIRRNLAVALAVDGLFDAADQLAGSPLPRTLHHAGGEAIAGFMGLKRRRPADEAGWTARLASRKPEPALR
jgi:Flp pilus assembly protein TadD